MKQLEWRKCQRCGKSLLRAHLEGSSVVEIKCERCSALNVLTGEALPAELQPDGVGGFSVLTKR